MAAGYGLLNQATLRPVRRTPRGVDAPAQPEVSLPRRIALGPSHNDSHRCRWLYGCDTEMPAKFAKQPIAFAMVAPGAGGHHVGPDVLPAARPWSDMIDRVGAGSAIHAGLPVPIEHGPAGKRHLPAIGHPHIAGQAHDARHRDGDPRRVHDVGPGLDDERLFGEDEDHRAAERHDAQRLVRCVQHQRTGHSDHLRLR